MLTYREAADYILRVPKFTKKHPLEHSVRFLDYLGNPQEELRILHVAGTNGKGSVCAYLDAMLRAEEKRVGLFISPHLIRLNERIRIDGADIADNDFCAVFAETMEAVCRMQKDGLEHPTFFELLLGMALMAFRRFGMEYAVLETGLGGRLDATTAAGIPEVCAITRLGLDHTAYLGSTLPEIAAEKAGILCENVPVCYVRTSRESDRVIEERAKALHCPCVGIGAEDYFLTEHKEAEQSANHMEFCCCDPYYGGMRWRVPNAADYQAENALLALETMRVLRKKEEEPGRRPGERSDQDVHLKRWQRALEETVWPGRMEEVLPQVYIDGAHNISAADACAKNIRRMQKSPAVILFAVMKDKDYRAMIACLCERVCIARVIATSVGGGRAEDPEALAAEFRRHTKAEVRVRKNVQEAFFEAAACAPENPVYCLGSLYLAGEIKKILQEGKSGGGV